MEVLCFPQACTSRFSHQVHGGGARWVWLDQQLGGDLPTRLNLGLNHLQPERQRDGVNGGEEEEGHTLRTRYKSSLGKPHKPLPFPLFSLNMQSPIHPSSDQAPDSG